MDGRELLPTIFKTAEHIEVCHKIAEETRGIREVDVVLAVSVEWDGLTETPGWT